MARHRAFLVLTVIGVSLRVAALWGFRWQLWFNDSYSYVGSAVRIEPHLARPNGYAFFLTVFKPFHAYWPITVIQHILGVAVAVMIYLLLLRLGVRRWMACLAAAPVLLDAYQIQLEQMILSDALFLFLIMALLWVVLRGRLTVPAAAGAGVLLALTVLTRSIGLGLIIVLLVWLLIQRTPWRVMGALVVACALPLVGYAAWFDSAHGRLALSNSDGVFLYSRVMKFADCTRFAVPEDQRALCDPRPTGERPSSQFYIWGADSPLARVPGERFSIAKNELAGRFGRQAIKAQPLDYLAAVGDDLGRTFRWDRSVFPDAYTYGLYEFGTPSPPVPSWAQPGLRRFGGGDSPTRIVEPFSTIMETYQRYVYVRGTVFGLLLLVPLIGIRRLPRSPALLPWGFAWALVVVPAATAEFDYRYVLPAVPMACLAAALTFRRPEASS